VNMINSLRTFCLPVLSIMSAQNRRIRHLHCTAVIVGSCILLTGATAIGQITADSPYAIVLIPCPEGNESVGDGINNAGDVTGWSESRTVPIHPMIFTNNGDHFYLNMIPGDVNERGVDINEFGEVAGFARISRYAGIFWDSDGIPTDIGDLGGGFTEVTALNDLSQITGHSRETDGTPRAFIWDNGVMTDLGDVYPHKVHGTYGQAINNMNQIVGFSLDELGFFRAFIWEDGEMRDLGGFPLNPTWAYGINELGYVVGVVSDEVNNRGATGIVWKPNGEIVLLKKPNGRPWKNEARVINNHNIILGTHYKKNSLPGEPYWPVIWSTFDAEPFLVQALLPPNSGWIIDKAEDINDSNQIVGDGFRWGMWNQGYILTPVNYTFDLSSADPGVAGQVNSITASGLTPGTTVYIYASTRGGGTIIPGCTIQDNVMQIDTANKLVGVAIADINGEATVSGMVPAGASGRPLLFQAVIPDSCEISNLVDQMFD
jgi:probable HAF family extracellular repeat protein